MPQLLFRWTDNELIVANTGQPFTFGGLEALCASHLSDKTDGEQRVFASSVEASDLVTAIQMRYLEEYKANKNRITEDARAEAEAGRDYTNRLLLELMQNADDAAAERPIGYKGLGFKAVLDICESVFIYSGKLHVKFDRNASQQILHQHGFTKLVEVPVLRLPFLISGDQVNEETRQLLTQYDTVIVLPWKTGRILDLFKQEWQSVSADATVLILLHALQKVVWECPDGDQIEWHCKRNGDIELTVKTPAGGVTPSRWRIFREHAQQTPAAVAIPLENNLQPYHHDKVRVFFPTEESSPVPMILHGEFDLEQNRKRVRPAGNRDEIVQSLARCVALALSTVTDDGTFLDLLKPRVQLENMTSLEGEIWKGLKSAVENMKLPQSGVMISKVRLCPEAVGDFPWPSDQRLGNWNVFKEALRVRRTGGLCNLHVLLPGVDTPAREQVIRSFNLSAYFTIHDLQVLPLFPIGGQDMPVAVSDYHLFSPPKDGPPQSAPAGIRIAFLQKQFSEDCSKKAGVASLLKKLGVAEFSPASISKALIAHDLGSIQQEELWNYLQAVVTPMLNKSDSVMDWKDKCRKNLIERANVPCRNGEWRPAIEVYAGQDWTGDNFLEHAYASRSDRAFLCSPPEDKETRKHFELLARWLGVGWSPKVLPVVNYEDRRETKEGILWNGDMFPVPSMPSKWREHCAELRTTSRTDLRHYTARLRQDWTIDGDETLLRLPGVFASVVREWRYYKDLLYSVVYQSSNRQKDYDNDKPYPPPASYLAYLFKHVKWIPVEEGERLAAAHDVFIKGDQVYEELKGWVFAPSIDVNAAVAKEIGIRAGWEDVKKQDWLRWLKKSIETKPVETHDQQACITALYKQALRHFGERYDERKQQLWHKALWCVEKRLDNTAVWHLENDCQKIFYVDRPDLSRLRCEKLRIFPVELGWSGNRERVRKSFGVRPLSEHLHGVPKFTGEQKNVLAETIHIRFKNRVGSLAAFLKVKGDDPGAVQERWNELDFHVGCDLQVSIMLNGEQPEIQCPAAFFQPQNEQKAPALWLNAIVNFTDQGQPKDIVWEEVGSALCYSAGLPLEEGTVFCALLSCGEDSLERKLLNLGVTAHDIEKAIEPTPTPPDKRVGRQPLQVTTASSPADGTHGTVSLEGAGNDPIGANRGDITPEDDLDAFVEKLKEDDLRAINEKLKNQTPRRIEAIVERIARSDHKLIQSLKQSCEFRCQFPNCGIRIPKKDGGFYIEVAHIKPVRSGGPSVLENLLVLCPNHHKEFDFGRVEIIKQTSEFIHGKLNGKEFNLKLAIVL